jgi:hypothetical protein
LYRKPLAKICRLAFNKPHTKQSPEFLSGLFKYKKMWLLKNISLKFFIRQLICDALMQAEQRVYALPD